MGSRVGGSYGMLCVAAFGFMTGEPVLAGGVSPIANKRTEGILSGPYSEDPYDTALGDAEVVRSDPRTFDVMGFKLGMSVREADRNAKRLHLRSNGGGGRMPSFQARVAALAAARLNEKPAVTTKVLDRVALVGTDGSRYVLTFAATEAGAALSSLFYVTSLQGNTPARYLEALVARYGTPREKYAGADSMSAAWCSKGDPLGTCPDRPALHVSGGLEVTFSLRSGDEASRVLQKRIEAAGAALASSRAVRPRF